MRIEKVYTWFKFFDTFPYDHGDICNRPDGNSFLGMYTRLLALSIKNKGIIKISLKAKVTDAVSTLVNEPDLVKVRSLISILSRYGYMERIDKETLFFREAEELTASETSSARRMRRLRNEKNKSSNASQCYAPSQDSASQCSPCASQCSPIPPYKNINTPPKLSKDSNGISKDIPINRKNRRTNNKKCDCVTPMALGQWLINNKYITKAGFERDQWLITITECFSKASDYTCLVSIAAERVVNSTSKIKDKLNYFKRTFGHILANPEKYVENWDEIMKVRQERIDELIKIARTPWLTEEKEYK